MNINRTFFFFFSTPGESVNFDFAVAHCVLPAVGRNHSSYVSRGASTWKICPLHYDSRHPQVIYSSKLLYGTIKISYLNGITRLVLRNLNYLRLT